MKQRREKSFIFTRLQQSVCVRYTVGGKVVNTLENEKNTLPLLVYSANLASVPSSIRKRFKYLLELLESNVGA